MCVALIAAVFYCAQGRPHGENSAGTFSDASSKLLRRSVHRYHEVRRADHAVWLEHLFRRQSQIAGTVRGGVVAPVLAAEIQGVQQSGGWGALLRDKNIPLA